MDKKKLIITIVAVVAIIAIAIGISVANKDTKDTKSVYTISFNTDGGNKVVSQQVEEGQKTIKPAEPTKEGYEFLGWYLNGKYFDFETEIEGNLTLDAKWKELVVEDNKDDEKVEEDNKEENEVKEEEVKKYTVKFDSNGGSKVASKTVEKNKTVKAPADPTKDGYTFLGWYLGSTKYNFSKKVTKNITLKAKWEKVEEEKPTEPEKPVEPEVKEYTVKFDVDGKITTKTVKENETVTKPTNPTKEGYTFLGWYLGDTKFDFNTKITKNITLTTKWEKFEEEKPTEPEKPVEPEVKEYTVKFDVDGKVTTKTVKEGEKVSKPTNPTKDGYEFVGWYLGNAKFDFNTKITSNITLKAEWRKDDVVAYEEIDVENSVANQVRIYVTLNRKRVAGTVEMTSKSGKKVTVEVPATGVVKTKGTYTSISNPKVK